MVDVKKLISLVHDRTPLWDIKTKSYHNKDVRRKLWLEIATEFDTTTEVVKSKWQNLRDTFRKEQVKLTKMNAKSEALGDTLKPLSRWKFYSQLLFLKDNFSPRQSKTNKPVTILCYEGSDLNSQQDEKVMADERINYNDLDSSSISGETQDTEIFGNTVQKDPLPSKSPIPYKKTNILRKRKQVIRRSDTINELLSIEQKKIDLVEKINSRRNKDDDYHFLMSLLPHFHEIPKRRKLATKIKIQQILLNEISKQEVESSSSSVDYNSSSSASSPNMIQVSPNNTVISIESDCNQHPT
ncbi:unnamed protein product [Lymnaea stagnalis]|uniref:Transcription factor Adf-1 n=1 Tax=Lymnaea stagnalis TaxID=6523 RepID=A0AAV2HKL1_LYMST